MKLQKYLDRATEIVKKNSTEIAEHYYYLLCLMKVDSESAPKSPPTRLAWDVTRLPEARKLLNEIYDNEDVHDTHIETLFKEAIKTSKVMDEMRELSEEKRAEIMKEAETFKEAKAQEKQAQIAEENAIREREEKERQAQEQAEIEARNKARELYHGYGDMLTDKKFDKFHEEMSKLIRFENKIITTREYIEKLISEYNGYPVLIPKGDKQNKKPFDTYQMEYRKEINGKSHLLFVQLKKAEFLYAFHLHGEKMYVAKITEGGKTTILNYIERNPREVIKTHCIRTGVDYEDLMPFSCNEGIKCGNFKTDTPYFIEVREAI